MMNEKKPAHGGGSLRERERRAILETLNDTSWNISEAARRLEIGRSTLHRKIKRYGLRRGQSLAEMSGAGRSEEQGSRGEEHRGYGEASRGEEYQGMKSEEDIREHY